MRYPGILKSLGLLMLALLCAGRARAQIDSNFEGGFQPYGSYHGGNIDAVNLGNGSLTVKIPIASYPQVGKLNLSFDLIYQDWGFTASQYCYDDGMGGYYCDWLYFWNGSGFQVVDEGGGAAFWGLSDFVPPYDYTYYSYVTLGMSDGSAHQLGDTGSGFRALDGTGYFVTADLSSFTDADGVTFTGGCSPFFAWPPPGQAWGTGVSPCGAPRHDTNGNQITYSSSSGYTDSKNRSIGLPQSVSTGATTGPVSPACPSGSPLRNPTSAMYWSLPGSTPLLIKFCLVQVLLSEYTTNEQTAQLQNMIIFDTSGTPISTWTFQYNDNTTTLSTIAFPTGGTLSYTWNVGGGGWCSASANYDYADQVLTRTLDPNDGSTPARWTYAYGLGGTWPDYHPYAVVTDPTSTSNQTKHTFMGSCALHETQADYYQGSTTTGTLLKTVITSYSVSNPNLNHWHLYPITEPYNLVPSQITTTWPNGQQSATQMTYDSNSFTFYDGNYYTSSGALVDPYPQHALYGSLLTKKEFDYGSSSPLRETDTAYEWQSSGGYLAKNLLNLPFSVTVYDGSLTQTAATTYGYDEVVYGSSTCATSYCGNQSTVTRWLSGGTSPATHNIYNGNGMPTDEYDANGNHTCYTYDSTGAFLHEIQHPNPSSGSNCSTSLFELFSYDPDTGLMISHTDMNGQTTSYQYDSLRRTTRVDFPDTGWQTYCYMDTSSSPCSSPVPSFVFTKAIRSGNNFVETGIVDGFGRKTHIQLNSDPGGTDYTDYTYDSDGRLYTVSNPHRSSGSSTDGTTRYSYDALNRVTSVVEQDNSTVGTDYSNFPCTTVTDEVSNSRTSCADGLGRMNRVLEDPGSPPHLNYETDYTYDALDNLQSVTQSGSRQRSFVYDSLSRLVKAINPESGTTCYGTYSGPTCQQNGYDANSNLVYKTDARGITTTANYDALNRVTAKTYSDGTPALYFSYDVAPPWMADLTNVVGRLVEAYNQYAGASGSNAAATVNSYDAMGRVVRQWQQTPPTSPGGNFIYYNYDLAGNMTSLTFPSGRTITYTMNAASQPISAVDSGSGIDYATMGLYGPNGALTSLNNGANLLSTYYYNSRLQPCRAAINSSGTAPGSCLDSANSGNVMDYTYDFHLGASDNGNVYKVTNNRPSANDRSINYTYDSLNRIYEAYTDGDLWGETYSTDAWGNLHGIGNYAGKPAGEMIGQGVSSANQFTNVCNSNCYDLAGNLLNDGWNTYTYDAESHIGNAAGVAYVYDAFGRRVSKSNGTNYLFDLNNEVLAELNSGGSVTNEYVYFGGKRVARRDVSGNVFYYFADHLGTSRAIVQAGQTTPCYDQDFYPYGREVPHTAEVPAFVNTCPQNYKFTGKERDSESGLDNFGARYDSSQYGRFMTPDPEGIAGLTHMGDPQSWNGYSYVRNNPLNLTDPDGMNFKVCITDSDGDPQCTTYNDDKQFYSDAASSGATLSGGNIYVTGQNGDSVNIGSYTHFGNGTDDTVGSSDDPILFPMLFGAVSNAVKSAVRSGASLLGDMFGTGAESGGSGTASGSVNLADQKATTHILDGDVTGGGHASGTGIPGKSEFPAGWSGDKIMHAISDVATDPTSKVTQVGRTTLVDGTREGVNIRVVVRDGRIVSGYPTNVPRNP
jgi:RHS repeat-associated protein